MSKGILMLAIGHENYIKMAVNLAASIRDLSSIPIHLVHDGKYNSLDHLERSLFTSQSMPAEKLWHTNGHPDPVKAKTRLYELSPFKETLYLDVDMIWLSRPIEGLFDEVSDTDFAIMNTGKQEECYWAEPADIRSVVGGAHPMYIYYSELIYFVKNERTKEYFKSVKSNYDKPKVSCKDFAGSHMPDELAYIMASLETGVLPHMDKWLPVYWYLRDKRYRHLQPYQLSESFYAYSIGGNVTPEYAKAHYNNLSTHYAKRQGLKQPYQVRDKRSFIASRQKY